MTAMDGRDIRIDYVPMAELRRVCRCPSSRPSDGHMWTAQCDCPVCKERILTLTIDGRYADLFDYWWPKCWRCGTELELVWADAD